MRQIIEAIDLSLKTPLAGNIACIKFVLIDDLDKIKEIAKACQQPFVSQVSYLAVVCSDKTDVVRSYDEVGEKYVKQQAGAVIEQFLLKLTSFGLSSCWVGFFAEELVKKVIQLPDNIEVEAVIPIGYSMDTSASKRKPSVENSLFFNRWKNKLMVPRREIDN